ncbi:Interferon-induced guanylate-binding protein 2 [Cricetulus griseus]|uniref:Interferon-induced guanylate-binding protein 2 n=1 Tax=Cricetulus griseus TaxID=10029 RepID=G3INM5_CRIGR|nr:Interferon-induced guanylate-binding protein 2 [Cricetulus griseus]
MSDFKCKRVKMLRTVTSIQHYHYVTELTDLIKSKSSPEQSGVDDSANFVGFFPTFVWALRDFSLELEADGKPITADEYLEYSLTLTKGLQSLVLTYVKAISSGELPCMKNSVLTLAQIENSAAVQKAIEHYEEQMNQKVQLPTETLQELLDMHRPIESEAIEVFIKKSFKDVGQKFQKKLRDQLVVKRDAFIKKNMDVSSAHCSDLLKDIFGPLEEEVKQGTFSKPGGYYLFLQKKRELEKKYNQTPGKGLQAEEMLKKYFESKDDMVETLLKTDQSLTEATKEIEVERIKAEALEATNRALAEKQNKYELLMAEKDKSYQEHMKQLTEKMQQERVQLMAENEKIISLKLKVLDHIISASSCVPIQHECIRLGVGGARL